MDWNVDWYAVVGLAVYGFVCYCIGLRATAKDMERMHEFANDLHRENVWLRGVVANQTEQLELADEAIARQKEIVALYEDSQ